MYVLKNVQHSARFDHPDAIGEPPLAVHLTPRGEPGCCTGVLTESQIAAAQKLPGFGEKVVLWVVQTAAPAAAATSPGGAPPASKTTSNDDKKKE